MACSILKSPRVRRGGSTCGKEHLRREARVDEEPHCSIRGQGTNPLATVPIDCCVCFLPSSILSVDCRKDLPCLRSMCYKWCRMFSRNLSVPEALRHYADTRTGALQRIAEPLRFSRNNNGTDRVYHAKEAAKTATQCLNLLDFMPAHIPELPTDDATIAVLRQDVEKMNSAIEQSRALLPHRWGPLAQ